MSVDSYEQDMLATIAHICAAEGLAYAQRFSPDAMEVQCGPFMLTTSAHLDALDGEQAVLIIQDLSWDMDDETFAAHLDAGEITKINKTVIYAPVSERANTISMLKEELAEWLKTEPEEVKAFKESVYTDEMIDYSVSVIDALRNENEVLKLKLGQ